MKRKKATHSITEHNVEDHVFKIMGDIEEETDINECVAKITKIVKNVYGGKQISKKIYFFPLMMYISIPKKVYLSAVMSIIGEWHPKGNSMLIHENAVKLWSSLLMFICQIL